ncbi:MAG TPA: prolyl oligopeptidase family serine peptidase [Fimbriimonadaceae bacterium]|jgi:poly(3-hydroxybutyrate) depolymerase
MLVPLISLLCAQSTSIDFPGNQQTLQITTLLAIPPTGRGGRIPFAIDPIEKQIVTGEMASPTDGASVTAANGAKRQWHIFKADKNGNFSGAPFEGGYAYCQINSDSDRPVILHTTGDTMMYLNGVPRTGDPYGNGYVEIPAMLKKGENELLVLTGRGSLSVGLESPKSEVRINPSDMTMPDAVLDTKTNDDFGAVVLENCTASPQRDLTVVANFPGKGAKETSVPEIQPYSILKVRVNLPQEDWQKDAEVPLTITVQKNGKSLDETSTKFRIRKSTQTRKETYISPVDDSVQYYAVVPPPDPMPGLAMMLSLHGAGVEASGQADAYSSKDWAYVACATNRRPYAFDWEDWGREDGLDVLKVAAKEYATDPQHTYVTGHSMGGHGTWQFGALFPDKWAAIAVSAGWASFYTYVGVPLNAHPAPIAGIFQRAAATSNTMALLSNYNDEGVYILHGGADDNVPVEEARNMHAALSAFDLDTVYHEQPGVGHWWSTPLTKGASCLEWPEMMDYLKAHTKREAKTIDFTTVDLAVSPSYNGVTILGQIKPLTPSHIHIDAAGNVSTSNVARLYLPANYNSGQLLIDGQHVYSSSGNYEFANGAWQICARGPSSQIGPFKEAFNNHAVLVYGTTGNAEENAWSFNKARFDSESFWYRGNGALKVVSDKEFLADRHRFGNAIVYGNKDTNAAWSVLFGRAPIQVSRHKLQVHDKTISGNRTAALFCWREPGGTLNAAVSATGVAGFRTLDRTPYFVSGVGFPDWTIYNPDVFSGGYAGVEGAGFFGPKGQYWAENSAWK